MDPIEVMQKVLRILFYVCVVVTIAAYAADRWFDYPNVYWMYAGLGAIGTSLIRFVMRFI